MKTYKKILIILGILIGFFLLIIILKYSKDIPTQHKQIKPVSSKKQPVQKEILTYKKIDSVLNTFEKVPYEKLDPAYINNSGYLDEPYNSNIEGSIFYKITGNEILKVLVGKYTIKDFLPHDSYYNKNMRSLNSNYTQYLLIETYVLHRLLDLILILKSQGFNKYGFSINEAYRYPSFNMEVGGVPFSQHIYGNAIDIEIKDINNDGAYSDADKKIVLDILENQIFSNYGGIGRYPDTNVVHFDTRTTRTIWNEQY